MKDIAYDGIAYHSWFFLKSNTSICAFVRMYRSMVNCDENLAVVP